MKPPIKEVQDLQVVRELTGRNEWRVEWFDAGDGCYATIFAGPSSEERAARQGEIVGLKWKDIDLQKSTAVVRGALGTVTKNNEIREVPLLPAAVQLLRDLKPEQADRVGQVFSIEQNSLKMAFRRVTKKAKIDDLTFHDLRHIATSRLAKIYKNPLDLKRVTGHKDLKSLDRYYHTTAEELAIQAA